MAALSRHMQRQISIVTFEHYAKLPYSLPSRRIRDPHAKRQHIFASLLIRLSDDVSISYAIKLNQPLNEKMKSHFKLSPKDARTIIGAANRSNGLHNGIFPSCWPHCTYVWQLRHSSNANVCLYASDVCPFGSSTYTYTKHTRNTQTHCQTQATFDAIFRAILSGQIYFWHICTNMTKERNRNN